MGAHYWEAMTLDPPKSFETKLWLLQRASAIVLGACSIIHLGVIIEAVKAGLTAAEIINRVGGSTGWFIFYSIFVFAASVHAPIGLRTIIKESITASNLSITIAVSSFSLVLMGLGMWSIVGFYQLEQF